jgi:hypothetical protein
MEYGSGNEDPPVYPAGSASRWPIGPLGAAVQPEINSNTPTASSEQAAMPDRRVLLTSRLTPGLAVKFPILRPANAGRFAG